MPILHGFIPVPARPLPFGALTTTQIASLRTQIAADLARDLDALRKHATQLPSAESARNGLHLRRRIAATRASLDDLNGEPT